MKRIIGLFVLALSFVGFAQEPMSDYLRVSVVGYRMGEDGPVNNTLSSDVVALSQSSTSLSKTETCKISAQPGFGYEVSGWQKFFVDPTVRLTPGAAIGEANANTLTVAYDDGESNVMVYIAAVIRVNDRRSVTFAKSKFGEGTIGHDLGTYDAKKGDVFKLNAVPKMNDLTGVAHASFQRWSDGVTTPSRTVVVQSNDTFSARFVPMSWNVSFDANGGSVMPTSKRITCDSKYGILPTPSKLGYGFGGWYTALVGGSRIDADSKVDATGDQTLFARWDALRYKITTGVRFVCEKANGSVSGGGEFDYGRTISLQAYPQAGSQFVRWSDGNVRNPREISIVSNAEYVAEFDIARYFVTFTYKDATGKDVTTAPETVEHGAAATVVPTPAVYDQWAGHTFRSWSTEEYKRVTRDLKVVANYDYETYAVTFTYHDVYGNIVTSAVQNVIAGGSANPPSASVCDVWEGHALKGWDKSLDNIRESVNITAEYAVKSYTITFKLSNEQGTIISLPIVVQYNNEVSFAEANSHKGDWTGHTFIKWMLDGKEVKQGDVFATRDMTIVAVYEGYFTIVYDGNGAEGTMADSVFTNMTGEVSLEKNRYSKIGYEFQGWMTSPEPTNEVKYVDKYLIRGVGSETLYANWSPIEYHVIFKNTLNGAPCNIKPVEITYDKKTEITYNVGDFNPEVNEDFWNWNTREDGSGVSLDCKFDEDRGVTSLWVTNNLTTVKGETVILYAVEKK